MQHIRAKNTIAEVLLRKALWAKGIRQRKNYSKLPGKPDIAITKQRIVIFVDGDFWHAHGHEERPGEQIATNSNYWKAKMKRNVERDRYVNELLLEQGWLVLRFWESDIKRNLESCVDEVMEYF